MSLEELTDGGGLAEVAAMLGVPAGTDLSSLEVDSLRRRPQPQLVEAPQRLGMKGIAKLSKDALAKRIAEVLAEKAKTRTRSTNGTTAATAKKPNEAADEAPTNVVTHKFEVGERGGPA